MNIGLYMSSSRGQADFGWLKANFSFSFGNFFDKDRLQFGMLRVLNDDTISGGAGFGTHPHENMEIVTIPLEGGLKHRDSMGNEGVIRFGEVQVMSAGTGIQHSEMNASSREDAQTLQLWVFPEIENVTPRYDQRAFDITQHLNEFVTVVSPHDKTDNESLWIYQQAYFSLGIFDQEQPVSYKIKLPGNGAYLFLIEGEISVGENTLSQRDAAGITDTEIIELKILKKATILIVEVPMA